jgi:hypothetical protein
VVQAQGAVAPMQANLLLNALKTLDVARNQVRSAERQVYIASPDGGQDRGFG